MREDSIGAGSSHDRLTYHSQLQSFADESFVFDSYEIPEILQI